MSTPSNDSKDQKTLTASPTSSMEKKGTQDVPLAPLSPLLRAEQAQDPTGCTEVETVQSMFLSARTAADFVSIFSSDSPLFRRVHEMGTQLDELLTARDDYLACRDQLNAALESMGPCLPRLPYFADMVRKVDSIDILPRKEVKSLSQQTPNRHSSDPSQPKRDNTRPTPPSHEQLRQCGVVVKEDKPNKAQSIKEDSRSPPLPRRQTDRQNQRRQPRCPYCNRLGHQPTHCELYYCMHCKTNAPKHFAKYCTDNPNRGVDRRHLTPDAMAILRAKEELFASQSNPSDGDIRKLANTILSRQSGIPTPPHSPKDSIAKSTIPSTPTHTVLATGPTYKPIFTVPKKRSTPGNRKNLGRLRQLSPTSSHTSPGGTPNQCASPKHYARPRSPTPYDGDHEDLFDDEAYYNLDGEGNF